MKIQVFLTSEKCYCIVG